MLQATSGLFKVLKVCIKQSHMADEEARKTAEQDIEAVHVL